MAPLRGDASKASDSTTTAAVEKKATSAPSGGISVAKLDKVVVGSHPNQRASPPTVVPQPTVVPPTAPPAGSWGSAKASSTVSTTADVRSSTSSSSSGAGVVFEALAKPQTPADNGGVCSNMGKADWRMCSVCSKRHP